MISDTAIIIPSRIGSTRLPEKPLKIIGHKTMIEHVVDRALESNSGEVFVATDSDEIAQKSLAAGATPIMVTEDVETGTDRIYAALCKMPNSDKIKYIVNLQGDLPLINPDIISTVVAELKNTNAEMVTPITKELAEHPNDSSKVKVIKAYDNTALYFSRNTIPHGAEWHWHHIGIYGFAKHALEKFVNLPQSHTEITEKLEQLRALEHGIRIQLCIVDENVTSVDTAADLEKVREMHNNLHQNV